LIAIKREKTWIRDATEWSESYRRERENASGGKENYGRKRECNRRTLWVRESYGREL